MVIEQVRAGSVLATARAEMVTVEGEAILCQVFFLADTCGEEHPALEPSHLPWRKQLPRGSLYLLREQPG